MSYKTKNIIIIFALIFLGLFGLAKNSLAASPVLNFSDLTSGPATGLGDGKGSGTIVTVWGNNLGTPTITNGQPQSGYSITVGGVAAAYVYEWGNATYHAGHPTELYASPKTNYPAFKMQDIMFSLGAATPSGYQDVVVTTPGGSFTLAPAYNSGWTKAFYVRPGNLRFVCKSSGGGCDGTHNGSDSNSGTWASPWATIQNGVDSISAGDILYIGPGVNATSGITIGHWSAKAGTLANPYSVAAYPGASVTLSGPTGEYNLGNFSSQNHFWNFSKLKVTTPATCMDSYEGMRAVAIECVEPNPGTSCDADLGTETGSINGGLGTRNDTPFPEAAARASDIHYLGCYFHDIGCTTMNKQHHTVYLRNRADSLAQYGDELGWNYLADNLSNIGLNIYDEYTCGGWGTAMLVHDNMVVNQHGVGIGYNMSCNSGHYVPNDAYIYNNLVVTSGLSNNYDSGVTGVDIAYGCDSVTGHVYIYNNTMYGWSDSGIASGLQGGYELHHYNGGSCAAGGTLTVRNNLAIQTNGYPWQATAVYTQINPNTASNNGWYSTYQATPAAPSWASAPNVSGNPQFAGASTGDYSLTSGSPDVGAGYNTTATVKYDILGNFRPNPPSIGAFEYASGATDTTAPAAPSGLAVQ